MRELIAIPLESDRRAVEVLAALRRLQAEYDDRGASAGSGATTRGSVSPFEAHPGGRRRGWRRLGVAVLAALALGAAGAAVALLYGAPSSGIRPTQGVTDALPSPGVCGLLGAAGAALVWLLRRRPLRREPWRPGGHPRPTVTWRVSYVVRDPPSPQGSPRLRATILQVTLPAEAEGRLRAILARADATVAR
jgi:hypothetical protein